MANESWTIGGVSVTSGAFEMLELDATPPAARANWLTAADSESAVLSRKPLHENRKITMRLRVNPQASMDAALDQVGTLVDKLKAASDSDSGVAVVWSPKGSARSATFTCLNGEISGLPIGLSDIDYLWFQGQPVIDVSLDCLPYGRGTEVSAGTASSSTPFVTKEIASIPGDVSALGRLVVTDTATQSRRHVEWGLEGPLTYNNATSLLVDSDDMVTSGFSGTQTTATGAYDPNATGNSTITLSPIAGATTAMAGTGNLSHVGTFRVKARVQSGSLSNLFRLAWKAGDGLMSHNDWASPISTTGWQELDLGTIIIPTAVLGTQRWTGQIEIQGAASSPGTVLLDYLILVPQANGYGKARSQFSIGTGVIVAEDSFTGTTAGTALNGRTAALGGGTWATSGATTDFAFADDLSGEQIKRSTTSDASARFAILGSTSYTDTQVETLLYRDTFSSGGTLEMGVIARWVDSSNYLRATLLRDSAGTTRTFSLISRVAASDTTLVTYDLTTPVALWNPGAYYCVRIMAYASGRIIAYFLDQSKSTVLATLNATSSDVATGGTLASGKPGIYDRSGYTGVVNRYYDDFTVTTPAAEPITIYSGKTMQVRWDDAYRDDSTGTYSGLVRPYNGDHFLVPPGTSRVLVKARRNDIETDLDANVTDATKIEVFYTPRYLVIPRT